MTLRDFYNVDEDLFKQKLREVFSDEKWVEPFLTDLHHGLLHGNQVRLGAIKLIENLTDDEKDELINEGKQIDVDQPFESAVAAVEIASVFHDCGRFNDEGVIVLEEQNKHHLVGAERCVMLCDVLGLGAVKEFVHDAVLCHDFHNPEVTDHMKAPKTMIGKIVQSSDQLGWFHPGSLSRTLEFGAQLGYPFYVETDIDIRAGWKIHTPVPDVVTVLMHQLFGYCGPERFAICTAKEKVETYKEGLKKSILLAAEDKGVLEEVSNVIRGFEENRKV